MISSKGFLTHKYLFWLDSRKNILVVWILVAILFSIQGIASFRYNNYLIFENAFPHLLEELPLYDSFPGEYSDSLHYGPVFCILIAPFSLLPDWAGLLLWNIFNVGFLWWAITLLPIRRKSILFIGCLAIPDLVASTLSEQFNPIAGALIILSFVAVHRQKEFWAGFFIALGTLIKLYGIIGLAFFFFSSRKKYFTVSTLWWFAVLFFLPMLFSSPAYITGMYQSWFDSLTVKTYLI